MIASDWLGIPWLGFVSLSQIWDFCGYSLNTLKYPILGICYFFLEGWEPSNPDPKIGGELPLINSVPACYLPGA